MNHLFNISNKRILIIGASSGIGRQTAITLSELGAKLSLVARNEQKLIDTLECLSGSDHDYFVSDISEIDSIESLIKRCVNQNGPFDGMVYSAGISGDTPLKISKPEKVKSVFDVNYFGFFEIVRQITKKGNFNPGMRIVGISSVASLKGNKARSIYSSSKAAMDAAVRCMAKELAEKNICINTIAPGMTATGMYDEYIENYGKDSDANISLMNRQYLGVIQPIDIANAVAFLLSPAARMITGITLPVDGGLTTN